MHLNDRQVTYLPLLSGAEPFSALPQDAVKYLAGQCRQIWAERDQVILGKGEHPSGLPILISGRVKLSLLSTQGEERVLEIILPGRSFGEAAVLARAPCPLGAQALTRSRLLVVSMEALQHAIARWSEVAQALLGLVAQRLLALTSDLEACCLHSANERIMAFLLTHAQCDADEPDRAMLQLPAAKGVVASRLNLTPATFSRELHALAHEGLLDVVRREIRIPSLERLRERADTGSGASAPKTADDSVLA